jgi:hypothetical protein
MKAYRRCAPLIDNDVRKESGMNYWVSAVLFAVASLAHAQDIKGVHIGMTKDAYEKVIQAESSTVGGVYPKYMPTPEFDEEGKLTNYTMFFRASDYADVRDAVKTKYPRTKCVQSSVSNNFGAKFQQEHCTFGTLFLVRLGGDVETSVLSLQAPAPKKAKKEREQKKTDI